MHLHFTFNQDNRVARRKTMILVLLNFKNNIKLLQCFHISGTILIIKNYHASNINLDGCISYGLYHKFKIICTRISKLTFKILSEGIF